MVPLIIIVFLAIAFGGLVAFTVYLQRKEAVQFEQARKKHGWEEISRSGGYDVIPENEEKWKVEVRGGNSNSNASMTWSHSMSSHTPLVILPKSEIGVLNEIPIKGLRLLHSEILEDIKPISIGSENFGKRYLIYGNSGVNVFSIVQSYCWRVHGPWPLLVRMPVGICECACSVCTIFQLRPFRHCVCESA